MSGYTVIDFETTGLFPSHHDRVVEVGVVHVSDAGEVQDEWATLVNPERDVGPTRIHGITARDVLHAPKFADLAPYLLQAITGRAIVAHNARFDLGFLAAELERAGYVLSSRPLPGVCTMRWAGRFLPTSSRRLLDCGDAAQLDLSEAHQALADAEAAAGLLRSYIVECRVPPLPWASELAACMSYQWPTWPAHLTPPELVPRSEDAPKREASWLDRIVASMPRHANDGVDAYLDVLESALLDRYLSDYEEEALIRLAGELGLGRHILDEVHRDYLCAMARVALADGTLSNEERGDLDDVASLLGLSEADVDAAIALAPSRRANAAFALHPGDCVCLTGDMQRPRSEWEAVAVAKGLVVGGLTRRTRVLVAADPDSASRKATKARTYGVPIITEEAFDRLLGDLPEHLPG